MLCQHYSINSKDDMATLRTTLDERRKLGHAADGNDTEKKVRAILEDVKKNGLDAVVKYTREFDAPDFKPGLFRVKQARMRVAAEEVGPNDMRIIKEAADNIRNFHQHEVPKTWFSCPKEDLITGQMYIPMRRAGLYVPGGKGGETPLISSLLMTAIPAQVAGVREIAVATPPMADGTLNQYILAAAFHLGITEVYACGGAWAIAALAYGAGELAPVDIIAGPGNIWVTTAKRLLLGKVGIDMVAGPSEVLIFADHTARPDWIAADMLGQAEHDEMASSICVTTEPKLVDAVEKELKKQLATLPRADLAQAALSKWGGIVSVDTVEQAFDLINEIAPEHLELNCDSPWDVIPKVRAAGAIFVGQYSAESLGDYFSGPSHVLPTMGSARFSSGLGVQTFTRHANILYARPAMAQRAAESVARLARLEGLEAHARAAEIRKHK